jgi:hypothetical protein
VVPVADATEREFVRCGQPVLIPTRASSEPRIS